MQEQWAIENQEAADIKRALEESIADLDPFQHRPDAKVVYKLSAVVNHYGATPSSGACKSSLGQWKIPNLKSSADNFRPLKIILIY